MADVNQTITYTYRNQGLDALMKKINLMNNYLFLTTRELQKQTGLLRGSRTAMSGATKQTGLFSGQMAGLAIRFVGYNLILNQVMGAQQKLIDFVKKSVSAFREFETRMAEVSTILTGDALPAITSLTVGAELLSMKFGQATSDMAKGLYDILSAAFGAEDAINLLNTATKASIAGLSDVRTSVDIFTTILNAYGKTAEQAAYISDVMFQSVVRGKFQFEDLASALQYVVPIAAQSGITIDELSAALTTATRHGLRLDMTARGLALAIQNIINPSKQAADAADKYGIEMSGLALDAMGLYGWFEQLNVAVNKFGRHILGQLIPNMRSLRVAMVLAGDVGLAGFSDDLKLLAEMGNATEIALNKIMNTSKFVSNQLTQQWEKVSREVGADWDKMMLDIQRAILGIGKFFAGGDLTLEKSRFDAFRISGDVMQDAETYLSIMQELDDLAQEQAAWPETFAGLGRAEQYLEIQNVLFGAGTFDKLTLAIGAGTEKSLDFVDAWNEVIGGVQDSIEEVGNLEITLDNIVLSIEQFEDKLRKPMQFGWGGTQAAMGLENLKGTLYYQYEVLKAEQKYVDVTHDVSMGLQDEDYQYKSLSQSMQDAVTYVREYEEAQKEGRKETQAVTDAMRLLSIQMLELQLKGMMRRRGLTRSEQKKMKALQIEQAKSRLDIMKQQHEEEIDSTQDLYDQRKEEIDKFLLKLKEEQYQMKYTYDQQLIDFETMLGREETKLQNRYNWWETTNQKIIDSTETALGLFLGISDEFRQGLADEGIDVTALEQAYRNLNAARLGEAGTYPAEPTIPTTPTAPIPIPPGTMGPFAPGYQPLLGPTANTIIQNVNATIVNDMTARQLADLMATGVRSALLNQAGRTRSRVR